MSQVNVNKIISPDQALVTNGPCIENETNANIKIDSGTLYVDGVNNRVGIGTTTPIRSLDISGTGGWGLNAGLIRENFVNASGSTPSGDYNIDVNAGCSQLVGSSSGTFNANFRWSSSVTLNTSMGNYSVLQYSLIHTIAASNRYMNGVKVDGVSQTVEWVGGTAPTQAGSPDVASSSGYDIYQITILKTASSTYKVFVAQNHLS